MTRAVALALAVALAAGLLAGCDRGGGGDGDVDAVPGGVALDGSPREPTDWGVVEDVSFERIELAGGRSFRITRQLQCFATASLKPVPLLGRKGQFVHLRAVSGKVAWLASFGPVTALPGRAPAVLYVGRVRDWPAADRVHFSDGTVLPVDGGAGHPEPGTRVRVDIEPVSGRAMAFTEV